MKGDSQGVNSTPTVFVNGEKLQGYDWRTADGMKAILDCELNLLPRKSRSHRRIGFVSPPQQR